ncbi:MAG: hypothetical protein AAFX06_14140, partial [Planctomycetota bacterium]
MDRRALIVGSWLAKGRKEPTPQRIKSLTNRWKKLFANSDRGFRFRGLRGGRTKPEILHNPEVAELTRVLENSKDITANTELMFYFVGHSTAVGNSDIELILGLNQDKNDRTYKLSSCLSMFTEMSR